MGRGVEQRLRVRIGARRARGEASGKPVDRRFERVLGHDAVDQPHRLRLLRAETLAEIGHLEAALQTDGARQRIGRGPVGADADMAVGEGEEGVFVRYREVARGHQAQTETRHRAVHGGDDRFRHGPDRLDRGMDPVDEGFEAAPPFFRVRNLVEPGTEHRDIAASHEVVAGAPDRDAPDFLVRRRRFGHGTKRVRHVAVDRVQGLGPRQRQPAHAVRDGGVDGIVRRADHVGSSPEVSGTGRTGGMYEAGVSAASGC